MDEPAAACAAQQVELDRATVEAGKIAAWTCATARRHGIVALSEPIDLFAEAVSRPSDAEVELDPIERLLLAIERAGIIDGHRGVLLHAAYLRQRR